MANDLHSNNDTPITIDDLAVMVKQGFDELSRKIDERPTLTQFDELSRKIDERPTLTQFDELSRKIDERPTLAQIELKLNNMESRLKAGLVEKPLERDRILNEKTNAVAVKLEEKRVFTRVEVEEIRGIAPIAVSPAME